MYESVLFSFSCLLFLFSVPASATCPDFQQEITPLIEQPAVTFEVRELAATSDSQSLHSFSSDPLGSRMFACDKSGAIVELRIDNQLLQSNPILPDAQCSRDSRLVVDELNSDGSLDILFQTKPDSDLILWKSDGGERYAEAVKIQISGRLIGVVRQTADEEPQVVIAYEKSLSIHHLSALVEGSHEGPHRLLAEAEYPLRTLSLLPEVGGFVLSKVADDLILWNLFTEHATRFRLADFQPTGFAWFENTVWTDVNGDLLPDMVTHPKESRNPWLALNRSEVLTEQSYSQAEAIFIEVPLSFLGHQGAHFQLLGGADFDHDSVGDLLLFDQEQQQFSVAFSRSSVPATQLSFKYRGEPVADDGSGALCLPRHLVLDELQVESEELIVDTERSRLDTRRLLLRRKSALPGARFALGRVTAGPYACVGYNPSVWHLTPEVQQSKWGMLAHGTCSRSHALYSTSDFRPEHATAAWFLGVCCPLPHTDIVASDAPLVRAVKRCPEQHIAVGIIHGTPEEGVQRVLLCRQINTNIYRLEVATSGQYWGHGFSATSTRRIPAEAIPKAVRVGVRRYTHLEDRHDGCVGDPPGALLVGFDETRVGCAGHLYSTLSLRSKDSVDSTEDLPMYPSCRGLRDFLSPLGSCIEDTAE